MQKTQVQPRGQEDPLEKAMATHSTILAWENPSDREAWRAAVHGVAKDSNISLFLTIKRYIHTTVPFTLLMKQCSLAIYIFISQCYFTEREIRCNLYNKQSKKAGKYSRMDLLSLLIQHCFNQSIVNPQLKECLCWKIKSRMHDHIYVLVYCIGVFLSGLLHSV